MIQRVLYIFLAITILLISEVYGETFKELIAKPITVEKLIGTTESHVFGGWVGGLYIFPKRNLVIMSELTSVGTRVRSSVSFFDISRIAEFENSLELELVDDIGYDWRGRIWRASDQSPLEVDIFRKDSPQRWVKLGDDGIKFLKDNQISHLILGQ